VSTMDSRLKQLERIERWLETARPMERFQVGMIFALLHVLLMVSVQSLLPQVPVCDWSKFDVGRSGSSHQVIHSNEPRPPEGKVE
jgi:hypothetical protein